MCYKKNMKIYIFEVKNEDRNEKYHFKQKKNNNYKKQFQKSFNSFTCHRRKLTRPPRRCPALGKMC